jgi:hypothetical protein
MTKRNHNRPKTRRRPGALFTGAGSLFGRPDALRGAGIVSRRAARWLMNGELLAPPFGRQPHPAPNRRPASAPSSRPRSDDPRRATLRRRLKLAEAEIAADNVRATRRWGLRHLRPA